MLKGLFFRMCSTDSNSHNFASFVYSTHSFSKYQVVTIRFFFFIRVLITIILVLVLSSILLYIPNWVRNQFPWDITLLIRTALNERGNDTKKKYNGKAYILLILLHSLRGINWLEICFCFIVYIFSIFLAFPASYLMNLR